MSIDRRREGNEIGKVYTVGFKWISKASFRIKICETNLTNNKYQTSWQVHVCLLYDSLYFTMLCHWHNKKVKMLNNQCDKTVKKITIVSCKYF